MSNSNNIDEILQVTGQVLIRCLIIGVFVLLFWWGALALAGDLAYSVHSGIVLSISREQFDFIHYTGMLMTKSAISILFLLPYLAIRLVISKREKASG
jgi:hypothetical protein